MVKVVGMTIIMRAMMEGLDHGKRWEEVQRLMRESVPPRFQPKPHMALKIFKPQFSVQLICLSSFFRLCLFWLQSLRRVYQLLPPGVTVSPYWEADKWFSFGQLEVLGTARMIWMITTTSFLDPPATGRECSRAASDAYAATFGWTGGAQVCGAIIQEVLILC